MTDVEQVRVLLAELGPVLDLAGVHEQADANTWSLTAQDKTVIFVEFMPDDDRLWLSGEVATPRPEERARLYPLMLQYNAQWQQTGGVRLVLDGPEGAIVQACDIPASGLDLPRLSATVRDFRDMLDGWRQIVAGGSRAPAAAGATPGISAAGFIRG